MIATTATRQLDAERGLIGCILIDTRDTVIQQAVAADVDRAWFTDPRLAHIYQAAFDLFAAGKPVDCVTIGDALKPAGIVDSAALDALMSDAITTQHAAYYVEQMTAHHTRCALADVLLRLSSQVENLAPGDVADFVAKAQERVCRVGVADKDVRSLAGVARDVIADAKKPPEDRRGIPWPWPMWQRNLEPLTDELVYLAALPSVGKTALALNILTHAAQLGHRGSLASLESPRDKIVARLVQAMSGTDFRRLYRNPHSAKWSKVDAVPDALDALPLDITDTGMTCERLYAWGRAQVSRGAEFLVIDNMKHIRASEKYSGTVERFEAFSASLKWIRDDLGVPVIVLHHLTPRRDGSKADMNMSWSSEMEKDADLIMFLLEDDEGFTRYRSKDEPGNDAGIQSVRVEVRKNRDGRCAAFHMELCGETQQFTEEAKPQTATSGGGWG